MKEDLRIDLLLEIEEKITKEIIKMEKDDTKILKEIEDKETKEFNQINNTLGLPQILRGTWGVYF